MKRGRPLVVRGLDHRRTAPPTLLGSRVPGMAFTGASDGEEGPHSPPFRNWASLMASGPAGGGRVDGAFLTEPGSYEGESASLYSLEAVSYPPGRVGEERSLAADEGERRGVHTTGRRAGWHGGRRRLLQCLDHTSQADHPCDAAVLRLLRPPATCAREARTRTNGRFVGRRADFHYSSPFGMGSFGQSPPGASAFYGARPFSPFASTSAGAPSPYHPSGAPFSSFSPPFASGSYASPPTIHGHLSPNSSRHHPPAMPPPDPAPLFDSTETALFSSFLNTLDVDPNFLFNPVLPPGMPSPPSTSMLQTRERREEDRRERELLGREVGGLDIGTRSATAGLVSPTGRSADRVLPDLPDEVDEPEGDDGELVNADADAGDDDPDFEPVPSRGTRRKSRGGPAAGTGREKKPRTAMTRVDDEVDEGEDVEMAAADDGDYVDGAGFTASGRPRRSARAPRRLSSSTATSATARPRPSLSRPAQPPAPPATLDYDQGDDGDDAFETASATATASSSTPRVPLTESQKRSNHILSEQKRRNAIRSGFKDLVDLLLAGEQASGIVLGAAEEQDDGTGKKKKGKGTGRGRGRKGEVGVNASKSVVLTKASDYILWLERGNRALEQEVRRVQALLQHVTVQE